MIAREERAQQLPLDLGHAERLARDDLIVTPANAAAVALVERWPHWPAPAVVLAGPPGSGKTHLASIWRESTGAVALDSRRLGAHPPDRPMLIDDADLAGLDERGLFHLLNAIREQPGRLLLTARRFPAAWALHLPDVQSRLKAAPFVEIGEPDDALLGGVIAKLFADRQVEVEPHVVEYLVRRIERSLATARRVVERLDRMALERKTRISRAMAAEAVTAMDEGQATLDL